MNEKEINIVDKVLESAKKYGASDADVTFIKGTGQNIQVRLGKIESAERFEDFHIGLRVFLGKKSSSISTSKFDNFSIDEICQRALEMAKVAPEDPYSRLANNNEQANAFPRIELFDQTILSTEK